MREGQAKQEQEFPFNVHIYSHSIAGKTISEVRFYRWLVEGSTRLSQDGVSVRAFEVMVSVVQGRWFAARPR